MARVLVENAVIPKLGLMMEDLNYYRTTAMETKEHMERLMEVQRTWRSS